MQPILLRNCAFDASENLKRNSVLHDEHQQSHVAVIHKGNKPHLLLLNIDRINKWLSAIWICLFTSSFINSASRRPFRRLPNGVILLEFPVASQSKKRVADITMSLRHEPGKKICEYKQ